ncbi:helix-turn-helix transcriptional regulator, partial [Streptomyces sp. SID3343]|nr:helix-turn-helix transcriptional regulator [Streptomyces sp. SID3343]
MAHIDLTRHDLVLSARRRLSAGGVVVHGPVGIGKTFVLRALVDTAAERGEPILRIEPAATERELAFSSLADLLDPLADEAIGVLPPPQRSAVRVVLRREPPGPDGPDALALRLGVLAMLRALSARGPA